VKTSNLTLLVYVRPSVLSISRKCYTSLKLCSHDAPVFISFISSTRIGIPSSIHSFLPPTLPPSPSLPVSPILFLESHSHSGHLVRRIRTAGPRRCLVVSDAIQLVLITASALLSVKLLIEDVLARDKRMMNYEALLGSTRILLFVTLCLDLAAWPLTCRR
jgi:hypothetical protein